MGIKPAWRKSRYQEFAQQDSQCHPELTVNLPQLSHDFFEVFLEFDLEERRTMLSRGCSSERSKPGRWVIESTRLDNS